MTSPSVSVALRRITQLLRGLAFLTVNNNNKYSYYKFVNFENIIFGITTLDYRTQPLKASCYGHFEICLLYTACKQQYIYMMFMKISYSESAHSITAHNL